MTGTAGQIVRILLVEDSDDDAFFLVRTLKSHSRFSVIFHAKDGEEALAYIEGRKDFSNRAEYPLPDVMILDLKMPNQNGFDVLERLQGKTPRPKVIVYTSSDEPRDVSRAFALGCDAFQTKSGDAHKVAAFIESLSRLASGK
jgi:CheY-like chemotaxis protein